MQNNVAALHDATWKSPDPYEWAFRRKYGDVIYAVFWNVAAAEAYEVLHRVCGDHVIGRDEVSALREDADWQYRAFLNAINRQRSE